jgi:bacterioferritin (cytochrome b1)
MLKFPRTILFFLIAVLVAGALPLAAAAQPCGPGMGGLGPGRGMGMRGMRGAQVNIPDKLPTPKNQEWINKLRDILALEKLSVAQYGADQAKFQARMPYTMILRQEDWHVNWITALLKAYGLPAEVKTPAITPTNSLKQAFEVCIKLETDLIPQYDWLIQKAEDQTSAQVLSTILQQTRMHQHMFQRHLQMLGGA